MKWKRQRRELYQPPLARMETELRYAIINMDRFNARDRVAHQADLIPLAHVERGSSDKGLLAAQARIFMRSLVKIDGDNPAEIADAKRQAKELADALASPFTLISEWRLGHTRRQDEHEFRKG